jgi:signal transduction histidine kinase
MAITNIAHKQSTAEEIWMGERDQAEVVTGEFVKDMTHDLHTPLNVIIGLCQLLERDRKADLSPMQRDAVQRMERNAHTLLQTVDHLLACMRSGRFE